MPTRLSLGPTSTIVLIGLFVLIVLPAERAYGGDISAGALGNRSNNATFVAQ